jgi:hypothetical protein
VIGAWIKNLGLGRQEFVEGVYDVPRVPESGPGVTKTLIGYKYCDTWL